MLANHSHSTILISEKWRILGLQPRDKAAMLVVKPINSHNFCRIYMKMELSSQRREMLLFLITNMAAVRSRTNHQLLRRKNCPPITQEHSHHFAMPPLVSPRNDVWATSAEISHWWRVAAQIIRVMLLIGRTVSEICFSQSEALPRHNQYGISVLVSRLFSQAIGRLSPNSWSVVAKQ